MANPKFPTVPVSQLMQKGLVPDATPPPPFVLVVDDECLIADTLVEILRRKGYAASAAYNARTALEMALLIPPQVLITDVVMQGMNGIVLAIAVQETVPDCHILLLSGQAGTMDMLADANRRGYDFPILAKPVYPGALLARIAELCAVQEVVRPTSPYSVGHAS